MNIRDKFLEDLIVLLEKYKADITCADHWQGYAECGQDLRITIDFDDYKVGDIEFKDYIDISTIKKRMSTA